MTQISTDSVISIPTGIVGIVLAAIALAARLSVPQLSPDPRTAVATIAVILSLIGLIVSIIGVLQNSGRAIGIAGTGHWVHAAMQLLVQNHRFHIQSMLHNRIDWIVGECS